MTEAGYCLPGLLDSLGQQPGCPKDLSHSIFTSSLEQVLSTPLPARSHFYLFFSTLMATTLTCLSRPYLSLPSCALHFQILLSTPPPIHSPPRCQSIGQILSFTCINLVTVVNALRIKMKLLVIGCKALQHWFCPTSLPTGLPGVCQAFSCLSAFALAGPSPKNIFPLILHTPNSF